MNHGLPIVSFKKCMHSLHNRMISNTWFHYKFWHISQILSGYIKRLKFVFVLNCAVIIVHCGCVECFSSVPKNAQLRIYYAQISKSDAEAIGPHEDLLTIVERRKMQWYGHVSRSSGLAKTVLQGTVKGRRRQDSLKKRWEGNIREWTGLEFAKSHSAVENREKWRKLVVKSSVVSKRLSTMVRSSCGPIAPASDFEICA